MSTKDWIKFIIISLLWGSTFLWIKLALQELGPYTIVCLRVFFAILVLAIAVIARGKFKFSKDMLFTFMFLGIFNAVIPYVLITWGEINLASWLASILLSIVPFFTNFFGSFFIAEENFTLKKILGLILGFSGVVVLVLNGNEQQPTGHFISVLAIFGAAISYSISNVYTRLKTSSIPPLMLALGQMCTALIIITPFAAVIEAPFSLPQQPLTWISLIALGVFSGSAALVLFFSLIRSIGPTRTSLVTYAFPLVGVLLGILVLGEKPGWQLLTGTPLIIAGILVVNTNWLSKKKV